MHAQNFNSGPKSPKMGDLHPQDLFFFEQNFPTRIKFPDRLKVRVVT